MNENMNANNDVVIVEKNDNDTTTRKTNANASRTRTTTKNDTKNVVVESSTRATTRALRDVKLRANEKSKTIRDDANNEIVVVRTSTNALRIDHANCAHTHDASLNQKNARSQCRARIARANDKTKK